MNTNEQLIRHLIAAGVLYSPSLIYAFKVCDRIHFIPEEFYPRAYDDHPLPIGDSQTISQPTTVAIMLELLNPTSGNKLLDIGSGSGWTTALLASAIGRDGYVEGVKRIPSLVEYAHDNLEKVHIHNGSISLANPSVLGKLGEHYDRILVSASAAEMPTELFDQLKVGGILVIPVQNSLWRITKKENGVIESSEFPGFVFVPLILSP
jgi:protein-L-isoaspartate(D-aspartate) O-methyltransferase